MPNLFYYKRRENLYRKRKKTQKNQWVWQFNNCLSDLYKGEKEIVYRVYENGMIIYYYRNRQEEREPSTVTVPEGEKERKKNWGKLFTPIGILTIVAVAGVFAANLVENVLTGGAGIADDALCYSAIAAMILSVVGSDEIEECEDAN